jgi:hypothetical protein
MEEVQGTEVRRAVMMVCEEFVRDVFKLPESTRIVDIVRSWHLGNAFAFIVEDDQFPATEEGSKLPEVVGMYDLDPTTNKPKFLGYDLWDMGRVSSNVVTIEEA